MCVLCSMFLSVSVHTCAHRHFCVYTLCLGFVSVFSVECLTLKVNRRQRPAYWLNEMSEIRRRSNEGRGQERYTGKRF